VRHVAGETACPTKMCACITNRFMVSL
jgi:hypothetical protein